jgi:hypothetical protein
MKQRYWYSVKQKASLMMAYGWRYHAMFARISNGRVVEYTMTALVGQTAPQEWDDAVCLGEGQFDHFEDMQIVLRT